MAPKEGEALVKEATKGPVALRVTVSPKVPRLSDLVDLTLETRAAPEVEVKPPAFGQAVGEFLIRSYRDLPPRMEGGQSVRGWTYKLEPVRSGKHLIRSLGVTFVDRRAESEAKDKTVEIEADPLELDVTSSVGEGKPDLGALAPMEEPRPLEARPWPAWKLAALAGGALALAAIVAVILLRKKKLALAEVVRTPEEIALAELQQLMQERLPEQGLVVEFYVKLTGIVRRYIERKTGIRAPEQTTEEFLRAMRGDTRFDPEQALQLERFLEASDLVKYAAQRPAAREIEEAFRHAQLFVSAGGRGLVLAPKPAEAPAPVAAGSAKGGA
ncbi:MAG: hypothetical protein HY291_08805 [Planctomycetes bacterium]|nr:hypothetical protein [Planctomycetota bacterium]